MATASRSSSLRNDVIPAARRRGSPDALEEPASHQARHCQAGASVRRPALGASAPGVLCVYFFFDSVRAALVASLPSVSSVSAASVAAWPHQLAVSALHGEHRTQPDDPGHQRHRAAATAVRFRLRPPPHSRDSGSRQAETGSSAIHRSMSSASARHEP